MTQSDKPSSPTSTDTKIDKAIEEILKHFERLCAKHYRDPSKDGLSTLNRHESATIALKTLLTSEKNKAVVEAKEARIRQNQSFCGCPFCTHHSDPYERHVKDAQLRSEDE